MHKIKCIVVDDEELARKLIKTYIQKVDSLECVATFENPLEALSLLKSSKIDLLFLDIQMPDIKGTDFAELINTTDTRIIFTTAYSEYALKGFELNALDYLVKPITFKRFLSAVERLPKQESSEENYIIIKSGYDLHKVLYQDIIFIESDSEYVNYHLENGKKIMANQSLGKLESILPNTFLRVHRSYIVNKEKVTGLKNRELLLSKEKIPVSDSYYNAVKKDLFNN
ncbi:LytR/AlgR family response regulator transcription factor [Aequorivita antarctica]|uniref:Response regulator transcription factor n=1 Tax=Aequorivita antarctica TaxID=153266 RepID=A0A5C6YXS7_9FLAO|nr:LytTR family DNA-binding domain-containing protein [Aequorivita antarctica]TXD72256.1 response regulator transcription factor [Aequorivita antarctica]SRX74388.1 Transcriptional regulatory protein YehT [Aequorivita antarctica]